MNIYQPALNHKWGFSTQKGKHHYDFDAIYKKYKDESNLEALFDALIETLEKMINSGEIDSITAVYLIKMTRNCWKTVRLTQKKANNRLHRIRSFSCEPGR